MVEGLAHPNVRQQRGGIHHPGVPAALVNCLRNILADVTASVEHQWHDDSGCLLVAAGPLGIVWGLGDGGTDGLGDAGFGELDEPQFHRDTRQLASNALSQSTALGHTCLVAGAVGSDDQRSSAGEGIGHF